MNELEILIEDIEAFNQSCMLPNVDGWYGDLEDIRSHARCLLPVRLEDDGSQWMFDCKVGNAEFHLKLEADLSRKCVTTLQDCFFVGLDKQFVLDFLISISSRLNSHLILKEYLENDHIRYTIFKSGKQLQISNPKAYFDNLLTKWNDTTSRDLYEYFFGEKYYDKFGTYSKNLMSMMNIALYNDHIKHVVFGDDYVGELPGDGDPK